MKKGYYDEDDVLLDSPDMPDIGDLRTELENAFVQGRDTCKSGKSMDYVKRLAKHKSKEYRAELRRGFLWQKKHGKS